MKAISKILFLISILLSSSCGEDCLWGCEVPTLPDDCSTLTPEEVDRFDHMSITYLDDNEPSKAFEILECFRADSDLFTDSRKLRWLVARFEVYGFDTIFGVVSVLTSIADVVANGSTTETSIAGVPNINSYDDHADYRSSVIDPVMVVYGSINQAALSDDQGLAYGSLGTLVSIYLLNAYAFPDPASLFMGTYTALEVPLTASDETFITENLVCSMPGADTDCPNGSEPDIDPIALVLANAFYVP